MTIQFQISNLKFLSASLFASLLIAGCVSSPQPPAPPAVQRDLATTRASYWLDQPPVAHAYGPQFQPLWDACEQVARDDLFPLDRQDYRLGLLTTRPMISKQILEPWRRDAGTLHGVMQDSLTTIRRSVRFQIERMESGAFSMVPRVLVERETILERRITSAAQYRTAFSGPAAGTRSTADIEADVPVIYWTPIGRDPELEQQIATEVQEKLRGK
jgi:hypothetical protein